MREPHVDAGGAIDPGDVVVAVRAVDVGRERAAGGIRLRVLELRRRGAGHQVHQVLVVAILVQREVGHVLRLEVDADVRLVGLEDRGFRRDVDDSVSAPISRRPLMRTIPPAVIGTPVWTNSLKPCSVARRV